MIQPIPNKKQLHRHMRGLDQATEATWLCEFSPAILNCADWRGSSQAAGNTATHQRKPPGHHQNTPEDCLSDPCQLKFIWHIYSDFLSRILSDIYSDILSGILSDIYSDILSGIRSDIYSDILYGIRSDIYPGILSCIYSDILFAFDLTYIFWHSNKHSIRHLFWHCIWHSMWHLALGIDVQQCPLRSGYRSWGRAVPINIWLSQFGSGSAHCDLELAVGVWQCQLTSGSRSSGPAVPPAIWNSRLVSGSAHWDLALAVEVRHCKLWSGARS